MTQIQAEPTKQPGFLKTFFTNVSSKIKSCWTNIKKKEPRVTPEPVEEEPVKLRDLLWGPPMQNFVNYAVLCGAFFVIGSASAMLATRAFKLSTGQTETDTVSKADEATTGPNISTTVPISRISVDTAAFQVTAEGRCLVKDSVFEKSTLTIECQVKEGVTQSYQVRADAASVEYLVVQLRQPKENEYPLTFTSQRK